MNSKMAAPWKSVLGVSRQLSILRSSGILPLDNVWNCSVTQVRWFPARKSTRDKRERLKKAHKLRLASEPKIKDVSTRVKKAQPAARVRTDMYPAAQDVVDDCWLEFHNKRQLFPICDVIDMHREANHPTILNNPNANLFLTLELNMALEKKNRFLEPFSGVVRLPHSFNDGILKSVMAICKSDNDQQNALQAGADIVGGMSLIKRVLSGEVQAAEYRYVVSHVEMMPEVTALRGILKKKYPSVARGSIGVDMAVLVDKFKKGLEFNATKDTIAHDFAWIHVPVGSLKMENEQLEQNISAIVKAVCTFKLAKLDPLISVALLTCPPSKEKLAINVSKYEPKQIELDEDEDEQTQKKSKRR